MASGGQSSYSRKFTAPMSGQLADSKPLRVESALNGETVQIPFGIGCQRVSVAPNSGTDGLPTEDLVVEPLDVSTGVLEGISAFSVARDPGSINVALTGTNGIFPGREFNLLSEGAIWVLVEAAVTAVTTDTPAEVYCRYSANGGNTQLGAFSPTSDAGHNRLIKGARWLGNSVTRPDGTIVAKMYFSAAVEFGFNAS